MDQIEDIFKVQNAKILKTIAAIHKMVFLVFMVINDKQAAQKMNIYQRGGEKGTSWLEDKGAPCPLQERLGGSASKTITESCA